MSLYGMDYRSAKLTTDKIWQGDANNRPAEGDLPAGLDLLATLRDTTKLFPVVITDVWTKVETDATIIWGGTTITIMNLAVASGATEGVIHAVSVGLHLADIRHRVDWSKELFIQVVVGRYPTEATSPPTCYFQLKPTSASGALTRHGLGIRITNLTLAGESYGANGASVITDLATVMTVEYPYIIGIHFKPTEFIKWYVNGVLKGTQSTAGDLPSATFASEHYWVFSQVTAASPDDNLRFMIRTPFIVIQAM